MFINSICSERIKGTDPVDTAARQQEAFWLLNQMITEVAGRRFDDDELTKAEDDARQHVLTGEGFTAASRGEIHYQNSYNALRS